MTCERHYGPLGGLHNRRRFLADFLRSRQFARSGIEEEWAREVISGGNCEYAGFLGRFMDEIARRQGKKRWVEKTPAHIWYIERLARAFETAKFVHIIRDGRDVALSLRQLGWTHSFADNQLLQLLEGGMRWEVSTLQGRRAGRQLVEDRYLEIKYEDLVSEPADTMDTVGRFVEVAPSLESPKSEFDDSVESANSAFGSSSMKGISDEGVGRWRRRLDPTERSALAHAIGSTLEICGYRTGLEGRDLPLYTKIFSRVYPTVQALIRAAKTRSALGRMTETPLEVGDD